MAGDVDAGSTYSTPVCVAAVDANLAISPLLATVYLPSDHTGDQLVVP